MRVAASISSHGLGHLGQTAAVLNYFSSVNPDTRLSIISELNSETVSSRLNNIEQIVYFRVDVGVTQPDASKLDKEATFENYRHFHSKLPVWVDKLTNILTDFRPDILITNASYVPILAARKIGIPTIALCSINWYDIFFDTYRSNPNFDQLHCQAILDTIQECYRQADLFVQPIPFLPTKMRIPTTTIQPIAELSDTKIDLNRRAVRAELNVSENEFLSVVSFGGMNGNITEEFLAELALFSTILGPQTSSTMRKHDYRGKSFTRLLSASDLLITKPGYCSFVEAAFLGIPVIYTPREYWPETIFLIDWLQNSCPALPIGKAIPTLYRTAERLRSEHCPLKNAEPLGNRQFTELLKTYV
jgi:hypothetical protein